MKNPKNTKPRLSRAPGGRTTNYPSPEEVEDVRLANPGEQPEVQAILHHLEVHRSENARALWAEGWIGLWNKHLARYLSAKPIDQDWVREAKACFNLLLLYERFRGGEAIETLKLPRGGKQLKLATWERRIVLVYLRYDFYAGVPTSDQLPAVNPRWEPEQVEALAEEKGWGCVVGEFNREEVRVHLHLLEDPAPGFLGRARLLLPVLIGLDDSRRVPRQGPDDFPVRRKDEQVEKLLGIAYDPQAFRKQLEVLGQYTTGLLSLPVKAPESNLPAETSSKGNRSI